MKYREKRSEDKDVLKIYDDNSGYSMSIVLYRSLISFTHCTFEAPLDVNGRSSVYVTARSLREYDPDIKQHMFNPDLQYIETGAGLGEFVPNLVRNRVKQRPIIIDPIDYVILQPMIEYAEERVDDEYMREHLTELYNRCRIINDDSKVEVVNLPLEEAVRNPKLHGRADVVVDNAGPSNYSRYGYEFVWELEKKLLKPGGLLFSEVVESTGISKPQGFKYQA